MRAERNPAFDSGIDGLLQQHIDAAELGALLPTVAHLTDDFSILRPEWKPTVAFLNCACNLSPEEDAKARALCKERLSDFFASAKPVPPSPTYDQLSIIGDWMAGEEFEPILSYVAEECVTEDADLRKPNWNKSTIAPDRSFHVAIIGAGFSGLVMGLRLKQAGVPFTIYEKNEDIGGTWLENSYPGCRCDLNSFTYSYSFKRRTWNDVFSLQPEILEYMREFARENGLYDHIQFNTEVANAEWKEDRGGWELDVKTGNGPSAVFSNFVVSAVGQLNRPKLPDIPGIETFDGVSFHSARWDHSLDLEGKRVAIIGTGASSVQFTPYVARQAEHLTLFARSTAWFIPTPDLHAPVSDGEKWLLDNLPHYDIWKRAGLIVAIAIGVFDACIIDPDYPPTERAVSAKSDALRAQLLAWQEENIKDRPDLRDVVIPDSPIGAKRVIRDNGVWIETLKRDNVTIERGEIAEITPKGIKCADGTEHEVDVIIFGTGFRASDFLFPMNVQGRDGLDLMKFWDGDAHAYIGMTVPNFPNLFCLYGPTNNLAVHGGTIIQFSEMTVKYIIDAVHHLLETDAKAMDVRPEVYQSYVARTDDAMTKRSWGWSSASSWYKNKKGKGLNYPFPTKEFWLRTDHVNPSDFNVS